MVSPKNSDNKNTTNSSGLQLPKVDHPEENKHADYTMLTMFGENFNTKVKALFERVKMNELEKGMLEHHLNDFNNMATNLTKLASILKANKANEDNPSGKKDLDKIVAMFGPHEFWDTQPVQRCYDLVKTQVGEQFNECVEQRKLEEIST